MANKKAPKSWLINFGDGLAKSSVGDRFTYTLPNVTLQLKFVAFQEALGVLQFQDISTGMGFCFAPQDLPKSIKAVKATKPSSKKMYMVYEYTDFEGSEARPFFSKERALEAARSELSAPNRNWDTISVFELNEGEREGDVRLIARAARGNGVLTMVPVKK